MVNRRHVICVAFLLVPVMLVCLAACGGGNSAGNMKQAGPGTQTEPSGQTDQTGDNPGGPTQDTAGTGMQALSSPSVILAGLPERTVSGLELERVGSAIVDDFSQNVTIEGSAARFATTWENYDPGFAGLSFAAYRFNVRNHPTRPMIRFIWDQKPEDFDHLWVGLSNWEHNCWDWFHGPAGGVLDPGASGFEKYCETGTGDMLVAVLLYGKDSAQLNYLNVGEPVITFWPMTGQNAQHTGRSVVTGPQTSTVDWRLGNEEFDGGEICTGKDGTVYIKSRSGLTALSSTGEELWNQPVGIGLSSAVAIDTYGIIYHLSAGYLNAVSPQGRKLWSIELDGWNHSNGALAVGRDGTIYAGCRYGTLFAVDPSGTVKWSKLVAGGINSSPAIDLDGTIFISTVDKELVSLDHLGNELWRVDTSGRIYGSPVISKLDRIHVACDDGMLLTYDKAGNPVWSYDTGEELICSPAIGDDGSIYTGRLNLTAINANGTFGWKHLIRGEVAATPAVDGDGTIYVGGYQIFYAINRDGTLKWSTATEGSHSGAVIKADGSLLVRSADMLYAFRDGTNSPVEITEVYPTQLIGNEGDTVGFTVQFNGTDDGQATYEWNFGDAASPGYSTQKAPTCVLQEPGNYECSVKVGNQYGPPDVFEFWVIVNIPPEAVLNTDVTSGPAPLSVSFDASMSNDVSGGIVMYEWDFDGDGTFDDVTFDPYSSHTYETAGEYHAVVRVTDDWGARDVDEVVITVS